MATTTAPSSGTHKRPTFSCIRCAERKVKCDRQKPCSACVKHSIDCVFNPMLPTKKRKTRVKVKVLTDRLRQYEVLLQERGIDVGRLPGWSNNGSQHMTHTVSDQHVQHVVQLQTPLSLESEPSPYVLQTPTVQGQASFKFVENTLWNRVVEESLDPENDLEGSSDISEEQATSDHLGFALIRHTHPSGRPRHPSIDRIHRLWETFVSNVDPLTKVVHVHSLRPVVEKAANSPETIPRALEALMFAIYGSAVMSLGRIECEQQFAESRDHLLSQFISATETALSRAKVMETTSIVVLQALVIHLITVREIYTPRANWTLTGAAVRIAQGMGLERDGKYLGLSPFETEIRRRVWYQLKTHDSRTTELCGLSKYRDLDVGPHRAEWPINVNDDQLYPSMTELPSESDRLTDAVFIVTRCEMGKFAAARIANLRQEGKDLGQMNLDLSGQDRKDRESKIQALQEAIETKQLRYCDPSQPLDLVTMLVARYGLNVARFLMHHPRSWGSIEQTPLDERRKIWEVCLKLLEQQVMLQTNPFIKRFAWNAPWYRQWHAFIHVLDVLRAYPEVTDVDRAWKLIGETYDNNPDMIEDMKKPVHAAMGHLCLKAYGDREALLRSRNVVTLSVPDFIARLRHQRDCARLRRQKRDADSSRAATSADAAKSNVCQPSSSIVADCSDFSLDLTSNLTEASSELPHTVFDGTSPFTFSYGFDDPGFNIMDMDGLDTFLAADYVVDDMALDPIDWSKLDDWLAHGT